MQLVVKNGEVVATHLDSDTVSAEAYGQGALVVPYAGPLEALDRVGPPPVAGEVDRRAYAAPPLDLTAYAASVRYSAEVSGISVGGARVATDRESQGKIGNAFLLMQVSGAATVEFKAESGFVSLTADEFKALALAVGGHVQACFAREGEVSAAIAAGKTKTIKQVDSAFAPLFG